MSQLIRQAQSGRPVMPGQMATLGLHRDRPQLPPGLTGNTGPAGGRRPSGTGVIPARPVVSSTYAYLSNTTLEAVPLKVRSTWIRRAQLR